MLRPANGLDAEGSGTADPGTAGSGPLSTHKQRMSSQLLPRDRMNFNRRSQNELIRSADLNHFSFLRTLDSQIYE